MSGIFLKVILEYKRGLVEESLPVNRDYPSRF
jgi:hypothetical protein